MNGSELSSAANMPDNMSEGAVGRMGNFNAGVNGNKVKLTTPKATPADITSDIK